MENDFFTVKYLQTYVYNMFIILLLLYNNILFNILSTG